MMRDIVLVHSQTMPDIKTLIVNKVEYCPIKRILLESHIDPLRPARQINALIFTSRNAIQSLIQEIQRYKEMQSFKEIPSFVIGSQSAKVLKDNGFCVEFVGSNSYGEEFTSEIIPFLKKRKPLYFRAKKIVSGLDERLLEAGIALKQVIAYENKTLTLDSALKPEPRSIVIFTAPSNYYSFVQNFGWDGSYIAIAIGITTFGAFNKDVEGYVSPKQTIQSCLEFAQEIATKSP